jgi:UDP-glucose 4-epimerase
MAVLVTGGAGYIGSATVEYLLASGERVIVIDNLSRGHRTALPLTVEFVQGDVGDAALVKRVIRETGVESCIHFAAFAYVAESVEQPALYLENNLTQGLALFSTLLESAVKRVVFSSSCTTYGEPEKLPVSEDCPQCPTSPYGWTKLMLERALAAYDRAYGMKFVALRYFNAAGATEKCGEDHDPETHLVPSVLRAAAGVIPEVCVFGNSYATPDKTAIRDYVHIRDLADAHARALGYLRDGGNSEFLNLGSQQGSSVMEVIECARQITGKIIPVRVYAARAGDTGNSVADARRAEKVLGWKPRYSDLCTIIRTAWEWHVAHPQGYGESRYALVHS